MSETRADGEVAITMEDELPPPPSETGEELALDSTLDPGDLEGVSKLGEVIPIGTYHFRLDQVYLNWNDPAKDAKEEVKELGKQPGFGLLWSCQEEPYTGQTFMDNCPWVSDETLRQAREGNPAARALKNKRLIRAKSLMEAAGFQPATAFNFKKDFLDTNPEVKIKAGLSPGKMKDPDKPGEYLNTGDMGNKALKYYPLRRPH